MRGVFPLVRAVLLLRCLFSAEARREFRVYRENTRPARMLAEAFSTSVGMILLVTLGVAFYNTILVFYHLATTGDAVP